MPSLYRLVATLLGSIGRTGISPGCLDGLSCALQVAKFVAFVAGSFAALLLGITLLDEQLLERPLAGRLLVWWLATTGIVLTISRTFISGVCGGVPCGVWVLSELLG